VICILSLWGDEKVVIPEKAEQRLYAILDRDHPGWRDLPFEQQEHAISQLLEKILVHFCMRTEAARN
jgi:hypothetical protein